MPRVHFLNVHPGDCTIIEHVSERVTMVDICDGYIDTAEQRTKRSFAQLMEMLEPSLNPGGDFRMRDYPTNPLDYLQSVGITDVWRFILSHPDMDHMDGLAALVENVGIKNFWEAGIVRDKPSFDGGGFSEADWDCYEALRAGLQPSVTTLHPRAGARFAFANQGKDGVGNGDGLSILAPDRTLVDEASAGSDINDGSYVLLYRSQGGRIIIPGDAHDGTWDYVLKHHADAVENCSVLLAPHHGRDSKRDYEFLSHIKPKFTLFGLAPSEHLAYPAWNNRELPFITSNQAGNVVLEIFPGHIEVYVENERFAAACGVTNPTKNSQGYTLLTRVYEHAEAKRRANSYGASLRY